MLTVPPLATTVVPVPVPVETIAPPDQFRVPLMVKTPLPSRLPPWLSELVPLIDTFALLDEEVLPATTVAPSPETPARLAPLFRLNVPPPNETSPEAVPTNEPLPD